MIQLIFSKYLSTFVCVGVGSGILFLSGLYWIVKVAFGAPIQEGADLSAIAGDDLIATQLDLARAYIETNKKQLAEQILQLVIVRGSPYQKAEARTLLSLM